MIDDNVMLQYNDYEQDEENKFEPTIQSKKSRRENTQTSGSIFITNLGEEFGDNAEWNDYVEKQRKQSIKRNHRFSITSKADIQDNINFDIKSSESSQERLN